MGDRPDTEEYDEVDGLRAAVADHIEIIRQNDKSIAALEEKIKWLEPRVHDRDEWQQVALRNLKRIEGLKDQLIYWKELKDPNGELANANDELNLAADTHNEMAQRAEEAEAKFTQLSREHLGTLMKMSCDYNTMKDELTAQRDAALDVCRDFIVWTKVNFPTLRGIHKRLLKQAKAALK